MQWRDERRPMWQQKHAFDVRAARSLISYKPYASFHAHEDLARAVQQVRAFVGTSTSSPLKSIASLLALGSDSQVARFIEARMPDVRLLGVETMGDARKLAADNAILDARKANVEGTYHIFTTFERGSKKVHGSYTGMAGDQVVGARIESHFGHFAAARTRTHLDQAVYQPTTTEVIYLLATVAPNCALSALKECWSATTGGAVFPPSVTAASRLVAALDELVLCTYFEDLHSNLLGAPTQRHRNHVFLPLNAELPAGATNVDSAAALQETAAKRQQEKERVGKVAAVEKEAIDMDLYATIPAEVDAAGRLRVRILQNDFWCSLPPLLGRRPGPSSIRLDPVGDTRKRKMNLPLGAGPLASRLLDDCDVYVGGQVLDFAGQLIDDDDTRDDWPLLLDALDYCTSKNWELEPLVQQTRPEEVATRLLSRQGARLCTQGTTAIMPPLAPAVQEWYGAVEVGEPWTSGGWVLPAEMGASPGDHILVKMDSQVSPRLLKYAVRSPQDASIPARWSTLTVDPPHSRILVNLARWALGLPRRLSLQAGPGRPQNRPPLLRPMEAPEKLVPTPPRTSSRAEASSSSSHAAPSTSSSFRPTRP
ncbi:unnamed protein product [Parajaminaea phylloscopi]